EMHRLGCHRSEPTAEIDAAADESGKANDPVCVLEPIGVGSGLNGQLVRRARRPDADITGGGDIEAAGRRAGPDAEWQEAAPGEIANEEVRLVAGNVPGLGGETAAGVLSRRWPGVSLLRA